MNIFIFDFLLARLHKRGESAVEKGFAGWWKQGGGWKQM